jgi:hypothetical protein
MAFCCQGLKKMPDRLSEMTMLSDLLPDEDDNKSPHNKKTTQGAITMKTQTTQKKAVRELKNLRTEATNKKAADRNRCCRCCRCCRCW